MQPTLPFQLQIAQPLEALVNRKLRHVNYWLLDFELPTFHLDNPNASGIFAVSMQFDELFLVVSPAWNNDLRSTNTYHILTQLSTLEENAELTKAVSLLKIPANQAIAWHEPLDQKLMKVEVYGITESPQLICFAFQTVQLALAIGYSGDPLILGDGDELLVLSNEQWADQIVNLPKEWERIWTSFSDPHC